MLNNILWDLQMAVPPAFATFVESTDEVKILKKF